MVALLFPHFVTKVFLLVEKNETYENILSSFCIHTNMPLNGE